VPSLLIQNATIVTMNDTFELVHGSVSVRDGRIAAVADVPADLKHDRVIDAGGGIVMPGFVQTHVHLCQTLFRGYADDLPLMDWLRRRIWPMEAAHSPGSLRASTELAAAELLLTGTTTVLTMETVHDTDVVFETLRDVGLRATVGKCMMDLADDVPERLRERTTDSIAESVAVYKRWHGAAGGRLRAAFAPRFAVSCSRELLEAVGDLSAREQILVHTHASESREEIEIVQRRSGRRNMAYLADTGLASPRLCTAHCVWVDEAEQALMAERGVKAMHCPGSNLKLGSGVAPVPELLARGICVSLGADGAACNNHLDMFEEMRLAATLQAMRKGPGSLPARQTLWMATRNGARTLGLDAEIGSVEAGKRADLILVDRNRPHQAPGPDVYSTLVYATRGTDVRATIVDGDVLVDEFRLVQMDPAAVLASAREQARQLEVRAGLR
jgi:5-methylthioadenosine/S-adenosylhomocysteine deaminase